MSDPFQYAAQKLAEQASPELWPLAMVYFDPNTRGLKAAVLSTGAELIVGHGRKIGVIIEAQARQLCQQSSQHKPSSGRAATASPAPLSPPPPASDVER